MRNKFVIILLSVIVLMVNCKSNPIPERFAIGGVAQGTTYSIVYYAPQGVEIVSQNEIDSVLAVFDKSCSLYDTTSLISRLNTNQTDTVDQYITECEVLARHINQQSEGAYDITIKPLTEAYGFLRKKAVPVNFDSIMPLIGHDKIKIENKRLIKTDPRVAIDLNSIAQGYSVDLVSRYIDSKGISNYLVEIGGEIYCKGSKPDGKRWTIGIDTPTDDNLTPGQNVELIVELSDLGVNTSGNYRKFYQNEKGERINHTIDPRTGASATNDMLSATVIARDAATADGYATMFMVVGSEKAINFLKDHKELDGYIIYLDSTNNVQTFATDMITKNSYKPNSKKL